MKKTLQKGQIRSFSEKGRSLVIQDPLVARLGEQFIDFPHRQIRQRRSWCRHASGNTIVNSFAMVILRHPNRIELCLKTVE